MTAEAVGPIIARKEIWRVTANFQAGDQFYKDG
jgi:hypothetical protein